MTLICLTLAWSAGILAGHYLAFSPPTLMVLGGLVLIIGIICGLWQRRWLIPALGLALVLGMGRYALAQAEQGSGTLVALNDTGTVTVQGYVSAEPSERATYTQLQITAECARSGDGALRETSGKLLINVSPFPVYRYGDRLNITGHLMTPPATGDFDYRQYLALRGVQSLLKWPRVELLPGQTGSPLLRRLFDLKVRLRNAVEGSLPSPDAGLLTGILLGLGHTLPDDLYQAFRVTGLTHIIVISGFNISLLLQAVMLASQRWLHRWTTLLLSLGAVLLYTLFVGPSPPVVRAALIGAFFVGAQLAGRAPHALASLAGASLVMTIGNPLLLWGISFQLSFAATLALILIEPLLKRDLFAVMSGWMSQERARRWLKILGELLLATVAAQLATLPIIWAHFGELSLISLLANVLVLPVQPAIMALGFLTMALAAVWQPLGAITGCLVWPFLRYTIVIVQGLARLEWAALRLPAPSVLAIWGSYALLLAGVVLHRRADLRRLLQRLLFQRPRAKGSRSTGKTTNYALLGLVVSAVLVWAAVLSLPDGRLHISFLDVGQGDAILLRSPEGHVVLVDGGPDPLLLSSRLGQILPFWQRRIDLVVATHADSDHLAGLLRLVERYHVEQVLQPADMGRGPLATRWIELLAENQVPIVPAVRGAKILVGDSVWLEVLNPPAGVIASREDDDNRNSVVLCVTMGRCRALLTADIDVEAERQMVSRGEPPYATILKVAHHGAGSSSSASFIEAVRPQVAVVSVGADNRFGHPSEDVLSRLEERGCRVFRTDIQGTIECTTDGTMYWIKTARR